MKVFSKVVAFVAAGAMALAMLGCSGGSSSSSSQAPNFDVQDINITASGYTVGTDGTVNYAFVAVNPNDGHIAQNVTFSVTGYNAAGQMIAGSGESVETMYPGVETAVSGSTQLTMRGSTAAEQLDRIEIAPMMDSANWADTELTGTEIEDLLNIDRAYMNKADNGALTVTAEVSINNGDNGMIDLNNPDAKSDATDNPAYAAAEKAGSVQARAIVILEDEAGTPIFGGPVSTLTLNADGTVEAYKADIPGVPDYATCSLFVTPTTILK